MLLQSNGELAQMVERPLCMREVPGSMPGFSNFFSLFLFYRFNTCSYYFIRTEWKQ